MKDFKVEEERIQKDPSDSQHSHSKPRSHPLKKRKTEFAAMCLFLCIFFAHISILKKLFSSNFSRKFFSPRARASAHDVKKSGLLGARRRRGETIGTFGANICARHSHRDGREPGSSKSRRQGKRETTQNAVYDSWRRLFEKHSAMYAATLKKRFL